MPDDGYCLFCPQCGIESLLRTVYREERFVVAPERAGMYRYKSWLPVARTLAGDGCTGTFQSERINSLLGLQNLWMSFSGYWPERGICLRSGSFKELEAQCVLGRLPAQSNRVLTLASAGNTAAAFAMSCSAHAVPCVLFVPETALLRLRFASPIAPYVRLIAVAAPGDYTDAILAAEALATSGHFVLEGGARNVARRDGLATVLLNAYEAMGYLPDYYFQAIGSGTGAIAVYEAAMRIGGAEGRVPRLFLSQNLPFTPVFDAWNSPSQRMPGMDDAHAKAAISELYAPVLANRRPPYAVRGGLREALAATQGEVFAVDRQAAERAAKLFAELEGIDLDPAASVAFASLLQAAEHKRFPPEASLLLNLTGGGLARLERDYDMHALQPVWTAPLDAIRSPDFLDQVLALMG